MRNYSYIVLVPLFSFSISGKNCKVLENCLYSKIAAIDTKDKFVTDHEKVQQNRFECILALIWIFLQGQS